MTYIDYKVATDTTVTFTRNAARLRDIILNYSKVNRRWVNLIKNDTLSITGQVSGTDIAVKSYVRKITTTNPCCILIVQFGHIINY